MLYEGTNALQSLETHTAPNEGGYEARACLFQKQLYKWLPSSPPTPSLEDRKRERERINVERKCLVSW